MICNYLPDMKVIFIYADQFAFRVGQSTETANEEKKELTSYENVQAAFIHVERSDQEAENTNRIVTKLIKQAKWVARKNATNHIILHSFAHLAETKSDSDFAKMIFDQAQERLENAGFDVDQTPFGHFLDLDLQAPGRSLARVYYQID